MLLLLYYMAYHTNQKIPQYPVPENPSKVETDSITKKSHDLIMTIIKVAFACGTETKTIALSDKMLLREIQDVLHTAFELDREVVGLQNENSNEVFPISFLKKGLTYFSQFSSAKNALTIVLKDYVDGTEREELIRDSLMELVRAKVFDSIHVAELCEILENFTSDSMISREGFSSIIEEIIYLLLLHFTN